MRTNRDADVFLTGKCPKCENTVLYVNAENVEIRTGAGGETWNGISYKCPLCETILSVSIDPVALKTDILSDVLRGIREKR